MSDFTILNITDVEDQARSHGLSPGLESRFARDPLGTTKLGVTRETVNRAANGKPSGLFLWRFAKLAGFDAAKQLAETTKE